MHSISTSSVIPHLAALCLALMGSLAAEPVTKIKVEAGKGLQSFDGLGCGAIFYEAHMTSLAARGKMAEQEKLYDAMFKDVRTDYLHLFIRHHGFRQFASRLEPGMQVVASTVSGPEASGISKPGVKACAFRTKDGKRVVTNIANVQDQPVEITLHVSGVMTGTAQAWLTDGTRSVESQPAQSAKDGLKYSLPARGMLTVQTGSAGK